MTPALFLPFVILVIGLSGFGVVLVGRQIEGQRWRTSLVAYRLRLPADISVDAVTGWLSSVNASTHAVFLSLLPAPPVALEVVATARGIEHVLLVPTSMRDVMLASIRGCLPGVRIEELPDYMKQRPKYTVATEAAVSDHRRPLGAERAEVAASSLLASLHPLHTGEQVVVQWIITGGGIPRIVRSVSSQNQDGTWFLDGRVSVDSEAVRAERLKQKYPLLRANLRVGVVARDRRRAYRLYQKTWASLRILNASGVGVVRRWWLPVGMVGERITQLAMPIVFWPLTLNARELAGLIGFPVSSVPLPGLRLGAARQLPPSPGMPTTGSVFGVSNYPGNTSPIALATRDRLQHTWIVGKTGAGKSTLLGNLIVQDMQAGSGMVVVDARGDLVSTVLEHVPAHRKSDVIVLDPSQTARPIGFNILGIAKGEMGRELAVDHVLHIFQALYRSSWGPRTADILRASLLTLLLTKAPDGSIFTLVELPELLTNARFRRFVTSQSSLTPELRSFWRSYEALSEAARADSTGPLLNKLRAFVLKTPLRLLLGQSEGLDLNQIFTQRKILLVPLSRGTLGAETTQLVGSLLVASIWQLTLNRVQVPLERRRPVWLYADEFQETVRLPIDLADMLAQARALGLGLTLAHQHLSQLPEAVQKAVTGTACSQAVFQLDYDDAATLSRSFAPLTRDDLMGLDRFEVAMRPCVGGRTLSPVTLTTLPLPAAVSTADELLRLSSERYGVDRKMVETALQSRITVTKAGDQAGREQLS